MARFAHFCHRSSVLWTLLSKWGNNVRKKRSILAVVLMVAALVASSIAASAAQAAPARAGTDLPAQVRAALQRDLGVTAAQLDARLASEATAGARSARLENSLGAAFGGSWLAGDTGTLMVGVTSSARAAAVRAAGATPVVVQRSEGALEAARATLDRAEASAPASVHGWYVDVTSNTVVVEASASGAAAARRFADRAGVGRAVRVTTTATPQLFYDVRGGDAYYTTQFRCSIGFSVQGGYTTAGHCGRAGQTTSGFNRVAQGTFRASSFPGDDHAWVAVNSNWVPRPIVNGYGRGNVTVRGSTEAAVGASVCRSGSTTGWRCGTIQAKNQTVRYAEGTVSGLTRTSACAEGGDSGGSFISGNQAQGMTSGGSGNCTFGGTTFFQPVRETLSRYGLTLVTG
jgi:streptogrisin C